jgi:hypothetical protein
MKQFSFTFLVFCVFITTSLAADSCSQSTCFTEVSLGELIDKITILQIKNERVTDPVKLVNIRTELTILESTLRQTVAASEHLSSLMAELKEVNTKLWVIEDDIREKESKQEFDAQFIALARSVYFTNDHRCEIKREINKLLGSKLVEEKNYAQYAQTK